MKWSEGTIIGVHLDRWRGTLEFYLNRKPLGIAFSNIRPHLEVMGIKIEASLLEIRLHLQSKMSLKTCQIKSFSKLLTETVAILTVLALAAMYPNTAAYHDFRIMYG